jgi:hypothetical protein
MASPNWMFGVNPKDLIDQANSYNQSAAAGAAPPVAPAAALPPAAEMQSPKSEFIPPAAGIAGPLPPPIPMAGDLAGDGAAMPKSSPFSQADMAKWPKTLGWTRPDGASATMPSGDAREFFGAGRGNILSSLTDVDRINNPFGYDVAMQNLQRNMLGDQHAQDSIAMQRQQFGGMQGLEREKIAADTERAKIGAQSHLDAAKIQAGAMNGPGAIRGAVLSKVIEQYGNDPAQLRIAIDSLDKAMGMISPGGGEAAAPGGQRSDLVATDKALMDARRDAAPAISRPGEKGGAAVQSLDPDSIDNLLDRLASQNPSPELLRAFSGDIKAGKYGDPDAVLKAIASSMATNYVMAQPPATAGGYPSTYEIPGLFKLDRGPDAGPIDALGKGFSGAYSGGLPWTRITLPNGVEVPFSRSSIQNPFQDFGDHDQRAAAAPRRGAIAGGLIEALLSGQAR